MVCPVCEQHLERSAAPLSPEVRQADWCAVCGTHLGFLRQHPKRVASCVAVSIALGVGLFAALAWQVFGPLLRGWPAAGPGPWFWWAFCLGTFFLGFGLAANQQLGRVLRRLLRGRAR